MPDGKHAYVTNNSSNNVSLIDTATNTVVAMVAVGTGPYGVAATPDGKHVYVAHHGRNNVSVIDTTTNRVVATVTVGYNPIGVAVTPDGKHAYVANNGSGNVSVIDTATNTVVATIPVGTGPFGVAFGTPTIGTPTIPPPRHSLCYRRRRDCFTGCMDRISNDPFSDNCTCCCFGHPGRTCFYE